MKPKPLQRNSQMVPLPWSLAWRKAVVWWILPLGRTVSPSLSIHTRASHFMTGFGVANRWHKSGASSGMCNGGSAGCISATWQWVHWLHSQWEWGSCLQPSRKPLSPPSVSLYTYLLLTGWFNTFLYSQRRPYTLAGWLLILSTPSSFFPYYYSVQNWLCLDQYSSHPFSP